MKMKTFHKKINKKLINKKISVKVKKKKNVILSRKQTFFFNIYNSNNKIIML